MRRFGVFLVILAVLMLILPAGAQQEPGPIARVGLFKIKSGMGQQFEQGIKRHNDWHKKQNDKWEYHTWEVVSGENAGRFYRGTFGHHWDDFDAEEKWAAADSADSMVNMDPYVDSATPSFYAYLPKVSRPPTGEGPARLASLLWFHLHMGKNDEFMHAIGKVHEAIGKTNWPAHYEWYVMVNGGEHPTYVLSLPRTKWADFKPPEKAFDAMLEEAFGRQEAQSLLQELDKSIHCERSEIVSYRADLSYVPAAK